MTIKKDFDIYWRKEEADPYMWAVPLDPVTVREIADAAFRAGHKLGSTKAKKKERQKAFSRWYRSL